MSKKDLSWLPDQAEDLNTDLSFLPDKPAEVTTAPKESIGQKIVNFGKESFVKPAKTFYGGVLKAGASTADLLDFYSDKLANKIGVPETKNSIFEYLRDNWNHYGDKLQKEGLSEGVAKEVYSGLGKAGWDIPVKYMTVGKFALPIVGEVEGYKEGGVKGAVTGAGEGALMQGILKGVNKLPMKARIPTGAGVFGIVTPGEIKEKTAGAVVGGALSAMGPKENKEIPQEMDVRQLPTKETVPTEEQFAGNIRLSKYEPTVQEGIKEVVEKAPEIVNREVISNKDLKLRAEELLDTPTVKHLTSLPEGTLESEILKTRQGVSNFIKSAVVEDITKFKDQIDPIITKIGELSKVTATVGRGLQQFKIPIQEKTQLIKAIDEKIGQFKKDPILSKDKQLMDKLNEMRGLVGEGEFNPTIFDKFYEGWMNSILSNPMTHIVNTASNALFTVYKPLEKFFSAAIETPYAMVTGKRTHYFGEIPQMIKGAAKSLTETPDIVSGTKIDFIKPPAIEGAKGDIIRIPTKALQLEDDIFKRVNGMMELYSRSYATAKGEGLKGEPFQSRIRGLVQNPTQEIKSDVFKEELYRTFQDELGKAGNSVMGLRDNIPGMRWVIPFIKTPANIMKRALERTPLVAGKIAIKGLKQEYNQKELFSDLGLLGLAGATAGWVALKYMKGTITGNVPKDKGERDLFYRQGKQPNSIKIGNRWVPFARFEPLGLSVSLITNMIQDYAKSDKDIPEEKVADSLFGLAKTLTNKSYLSGMTNLINSIENPEQYGERFASRLTAGLIPYSGMARFFTGVVDKTMRRPVGVIESVKTQIPFLSQTIRPRLNAFGEEIKPPTILSKESISPIDKELSNIGMDIGFPSSRVFGKKLSDDDYNQYLQKSGKEIKERLDSLIQLPDYKTLSKEDKIDIIENIIRDERKDARERLFGGTK